MRKIAVILGSILAGLVPQPAPAQELEAFGPCGPVYPFRLEGDICQRMRPAVRGSKRDGVMNAAVPGVTPSCCVTKDFAIEQGRLRADTHAEACGERFERLYESARGKRKTIAGFQLRRLAEECPAELQKVAAAASAGGSSTSSGSMGSQLYGSLNRSSASDLEDLAARLRRDPSGDLQLADIIAIGIQLGSMASTLYPPRTIRFSAAGRTPGLGGNPRASVPYVPRQQRQSDITGTGR